MRSLVVLPAFFLFIEPATGTESRNFYQSCDLDFLSTNKSIDIRQAAENYDRELRSLSSSSKPSDLAAIVQFPFTILRDESVITVKDEKELSLQSTDILSEIQGSLSQFKDGLDCHPKLGLTFGPSMQIRASLVSKSSAPSFRIHTVVWRKNDRSKLPSLMNPSKVIACRSAKHRVQVDNIGEGKLRYRSWGIAADANATADLELFDGVEESLGGTAPCVQRQFSFANKNITYRVSESPCSKVKDASDLILRVLKNGKELYKWDCAQ